MKWQPIETAPKDGTEILVYKNVATVDIIHIASWVNQDEWMHETECGDGWWSYTENSVSQRMLEGYKYPTHWMPLPPLPEES